MAYPVGQMVCTAGETGDEAMVRTTELARELGQVDDAARGIVQG